MTKLALNSAAFCLSLHAAVVAAAPPPSQAPATDAGTAVPKPDGVPAATDRPASDTAASDTAASDTAASDTAASDTAASDTAASNAADASAVATDAEGPTGIQDPCSASSRQKAPPSEAPLDPAGYPQDYCEHFSTDPENARSWSAVPPSAREESYVWLPRAVLWPPKMLLTGVFYPVRKLATWVDHSYVVPRVVDLLYNDARTAAIVPVAGFSTGNGLSAGLKVFHSDLVGNGENLEAAAQYGGLYNQGYKLSFEGDGVARTPLWLDASARWETKPALFFNGIGNEPVPGDTAALADPRSAAVATRFREARAMGALTVGLTHRLGSGRIRVGATTIYNRRRFSPESGQRREPAIDEVYDTQLLAGFDDGVDVLEVTPVLVWDSRDSAGLTSEGLYVDAFGGRAVTVSGGSSYWHYGATVAGFINLFRRTRVLSLRAVVEAVDGGDRALPFSELIRLGGTQRLRGYQLDRFRDRKAVLLTAEYRYPINQMVAAELFLDVGRVGANYSQLFGKYGLRSPRFGGGLGMLFHDRKRTFFKLSAAYGEELLFFISTEPLTAFRRRHKRL